MVGNIANLFVSAAALAVLPASGVRPLRLPRSPRAENVRLDATAPALFRLSLDLGQAGTANLRMKPLLPQGSEAVVVKYKLPFGLNVENMDGRAVCTKDGDGGERVGDILRYTTQWTMGLPRGDGLISTAASFGGAIGWQIGLFDVARAASWDEVVEALVSNTPERTDSVTLVFERPAPPA